MITPDLTSHCLLLHRFFLFSLFLYTILSFPFFFFFSSRRRHTRCLSDWSSDVCSSDLRRGREIRALRPLSAAAFPARGGAHGGRGRGTGRRRTRPRWRSGALGVGHAVRQDRKSVV